MKRFFIICVFIASLGIMPQLARCDEAIETQVNAARQARLSGNYQAAISELSSVLKTEPEHFRALYNLALAHALHGNRPAAADAFERASAVLDSQSRPDYTLYNSYGWFLLTSGRLDEAETQFKRAMQHFDQLAPASQSRVLHNFGLLNLQLDRLAEAQALFTRAAEDYGNPLAKRNLRLVGELKQQSNRWTVVFGADRMESSAKDEVKRAADAGIASPFIVLRNDMYRSVATFRSRADAESALEAAKTFRPDAYLVGWESWCRTEPGGPTGCRTEF